MREFVGRRRELELLQSHERFVKKEGRGVLLSVRGRRQVGKSRLVEEFLHSTKTPSVFFTAAKGAASPIERQGFLDEVATSSLEMAGQLDGLHFETWEATFRWLASAISKPTIVAIDELPFLLQADKAFEGTLQKVWDRHLSRVPILLIVIGSDLSVMESLGSYDRPLYQRMREMVIDPFNPAEMAEMLDLDAEHAFDAYLVLGGFPRLAEMWQGEQNIHSLLKTQLRDSTSPLVVVGERILTAEFPEHLQASEVLRVVGSGATGYASLATQSGLNQGSLARSLQTLTTEKRVLASERPLSAKPSRNTLYRVTDPYLRFWLRFLGPNFDLLLRGRGDVIAKRIEEAWLEYRGRAIEPIVRASIERMLPDGRFGEALHVGSYWTRTGDVEVDLVGADKPEAPASVTFVGSVKWRERSPFARKDLLQLAAMRQVVPGAEEALLVGVSRSGFKTDELDVALTADDLLQSWQPR